MSDVEYGPLPDSLRETFVAWIHAHPEHKVYQEGPDGLIAVRSQGYTKQPSEYTDGGSAGFRKINGRWYDKKRNEIVLFENLPAFLWDECHRAAEATAKSRKASSKAALVSILSFESVMSKKTTLKKAYRPLYDEFRRQYNDFWDAKKHLKVKPQAPKQPRSDGSNSVPKDADQTSNVAFTVATTQQMGAILEPPVLPSDLTKSSRLWADEQIVDSAAYSPIDQGKLPSNPAMSEHYGREMASSSPLRLPTPIIHGEHTYSNDSNEPNPPAQPLFHPTNPQSSINRAEQAHHFLTNPAIPLIHRERSYSQNSQMDIPEVEAHDSPKTSYCSDNVNTKSSIPSPFEVSQPVNVERHDEMLLSTKDHSSASKTVSISDSAYWSSSQSNHGDHKFASSGLEALDLEVQTNIRELIDEMTSHAENVEHKKATMWHHQISQVAETFKGCGKATIYTPKLGKTPPQDIDVLCISNDELMKMLEDGTKMDTPVVIRKGLDELPKADMIGEFIIRAKRRQWTQMDVQDNGQIPNAGGNAVTKWPTSKVYERLTSPQLMLDGEHPPINLLNLPDFMNLPQPRFLHHSRLQIIHELDDMARGDFVGKASSETIKNPAKIAGTKRKVVPDLVRSMDVASCIKFLICAQRGAFSGPHIDSLAGTWVANLQGLKAWPILTHPTELEIAEFSEEGHAWIPKDPSRLKLIVLHPRDVLIMPPGVTVIHAPLTINDCLMMGGMFWDRKYILDVLETMAWLIPNNHLTNEAIQFQLPIILSQLRRSFDANPGDFLPTTFHGIELDEASFNKELTRVLDGIRKTITCGCASKCIAWCKLCKSEDCIHVCSCLNSAAQQNACNVWCHPKPSKGMGRGHDSSCVIHEG